MKTPLLSILFSIIIVSSIAQNNIGINNPTPDPSAVLDLTSSNMGFLPPRVADTNAISSPAEGLIIYDFTSHCMRYYNGSIWSDCMGNIVPVIPWNCGDQFIDDRDGQTYYTVQIGSQCWMAENINIGTMIDPATGGTNNDGNQSDNGTIEKYCYDNETSKCDTYGGLYQWDETMQYTTTPGAQGICPSGWHVPTDDEWCTLENEVDAGTISCSSTSWQGIDAGGNLKEAGTVHWNSPNTGATNSSGFRVRGAGNSHVSFGFANLKELATLWTSNETSSINCIYRTMTNTSAQILRSDGSLKSGGRSVRCLKD